MLATGWPKYASETLNQNHVQKLASRDSKSGQYARRESNASHLFSGELAVGQTRDIGLPGEEVTYCKGFILRLVRKKI